MTLFILLAAMVMIGLLSGWSAGLIWKKPRPMGLSGDLLYGILSAVLVGLLDWYLIPALGFSPTIKYIAIALEPLLGAILVLWLVRQAKS